ncbi:hypothetical protein ACJMK2_016328 [Sinanodonta woodiana]|uniref:Helicase ARIP4 n=1 Tax=Sinanodonta woodiana TaxID=1069815 RepID=A0ABD3UTG5_SINWO
MDPSLKALKNDAIKSCTLASYLAGGEPTLPTAGSVNIPVGPQNVGQSWLQKGLFSGNRGAKNIYDIEDQEIEEEDEDEYLEEEYEDMEEEDDDEDELFDEDDDDEEEDMEDEDDDEISEESSSNPEDLSKENSYSSLDELMGLDSFDESRDIDNSKDFSDSSVYNPRTEQILNSSLGLNREKCELGKSLPISNQDQATSQKRGLESVSQNSDFVSTAVSRVGDSMETTVSNKIVSDSQANQGTSETAENNETTQMSEASSVPKKKRKRKPKKEKDDAANKTTNGDGQQDVQPKEKKRRKRKRKKNGDDEADQLERKKNKLIYQRRNIRGIFKEGQLEKETLVAQQEELERIKRLSELKKAMMLKKEDQENKDSQLKSLLQNAEEEAEKAEKDDVIVVESNEVPSEKIKAEKDVIELSSDDEMDQKDDIVAVLSDSDDDEADPEDVNNGGNHINDALNRPDEMGRVLVNVNHPVEDPDIFLPPQIAAHIKPHQIGGIRFLYDNMVESKQRFETSQGFGCILAHSMGLGKTIQMIGFIDIFLRHTSSKTVLCIVPINTLQNWMAEFNTWMPDEEFVNITGATHILPRNYQIYLLNDNFKTTEARCKVIEEWYKTGGVLLIGYEMYRLLASKKAHLKKPRRTKKSPDDDIIDVDEEDKNKSLLVGVHFALVSPGPDLVVCDEGHRIKNSHAGISQSLKNIRTKRRVVLTGYPLQNNLMEYWCMVDFVRPNFLGTKTEFSNMFERPINNGQCPDSNPQDVKVMRYRAHVLHSLLEGFIQRRGHTVLQAALPPKQEYVFLVKMSPIQRALYKHLMESITDASLCAWANNNPLKAFAVCCKIWNHPDILYEVTTKKKACDADENDLDIDTEGNVKKKKATKETKPKVSASDGNPDRRSSEPVITYDWVKDLMKDYSEGVLENGGKMVVMLSIIKESLAVGDKILVFSQSLFTLSWIEEILSKQKVPRPDMDENWCRNKSYFRLDGSTGSTEREKLINQFNAPENTRAWLFLLSTRAGSLGVNLVGANRVVMMDASWNPCHDCQAICRVYRFGQEKPSFIYRLVTENSLERKIYDRQINKQGMSDRVIDELQPQNYRRKVDNLLAYEDKDFPVLDFSDAESRYDDEVMIKTLKEHGHWLAQAPFTHESLLIDRKELRLTQKEKRLAKQSYVMEKRLNISYSRPSYAAYYPQNNLQMQYRGKIITRPVASVKPMMSTPIPMRAKMGEQVVRPGVSVHQVLTTTDILLPGTNTATNSGVPKPNKIAAGQQVLIIKTPKGIYIRTTDGKIFAVRSKSGGLPASTTPNTTTTITCTTATTTMISTSNISTGVASSTTTPTVTVTTSTGTSVPAVKVAPSTKLPIAPVKPATVTQPVVISVPKGMASRTVPAAVVSVGSALEKSGQSNESLSASVANAQPDHNSPAPSVSVSLSGTNYDSKQAQKVCQPSYSAMESSSNDSSSATDVGISASNTWMSKQNTGMSEPNIEKSYSFTSDIVPAVTTSKISFVKGPDNSTKTDNITVERQKSETVTSVSNLHTSNTSLPSLNHSMSMQNFNQPPFDYTPSTNLTTLTSSKSVPSLTSAVYSNNNTINSVAQADDSSRSNSSYQFMNPDSDPFGDFRSDLSPLSALLNLTGGASTSDYSMATSAQSNDINSTSSVSYDLMETDSAAMMSYNSMPNTLSYNSPQMGYNTNPYFHMGGTMPHMGMPSMNYYGNQMTGANQSPYMSSYSFPGSQGMGSTSDYHQPHPSGQSQNSNSVNNAENNSSNSGMAGNNNQNNNLYNPLTTNSLSNMMVPQPAYMGYPMTPYPFSMPPMMYPTQTGPSGPLYFSMHLPTNPYSQMSGLQGMQSGPNSMGMGNPTMQHTNSGSSSTSGQEQMGNNTG